MSLAAYRIRKAVQKWHDQVTADIGEGRPELAQDSTLRTIAVALAGVLVIVDEELEREAERHFTQPIVNPAIG